MFALEAVLSGMRIDISTRTLVDMGAMYAPLVQSPADLYRFVTPMFLHMDLMHLGFNMVALYSVGEVLERTLGKGSYLALYFIAGITGNAVSYAADVLLGGGSAVSAGASTSVFGLFVAVALSIAGFYLLCITDGFGSIGLADILLVFTAVLFAVHILVIDTLGGTVDAIKLSFGQFCTTAVLSWAGSLIEGSVDWAGAAHSWIPILYAGIGSVGIAYTLQVVGQQWVPPTRASLLMSLESFFSAVGGALLLGEVMTPRGYLGCALIFLGTLLAQAPARLPKWPQR